MSFSRPIHWYYSHADPIWLDGTVKRVLFPGTGDGIPAAALLHDHHGGAVLQQSNQLHRPQGARPTGRKQLCS
jgi:hypothetical protein